MARIEFQLNMAEEQADFNKGYFMRLMRYLAAYRRQCLFALLFVVLGAGGEVAIPYLIRVGIDNHIMVGDFSGLLGVFGIFLAVLGVTTIARRQQIYLTAWIGQRVLYQLRQEVFAHLQRLSFRYFDSQPSGKIMSRLTSDVRYLQDFLTNGLTTLFAAIVSVVAILIVLFTLHAKLAALSLITLPVVLVTVISLRVRIKQAHLMVRETMANINANLQESISGVRLVQAYARQKVNEGHFERINRRNFQATMRSWLLAGAFNPAVELTSAGATVLILWYGARAVSSGSMAEGVTVGIIVAFVAYLQQFYDPVRELSNIYNGMQSAMASADKIFNLLDTPIEIVERPSAYDVTDVKGRVQFDNVTFGYSSAEPVLHNINLDVAPGETIALVGPTGAGKSSIINLVARFYDPQEGKVTLDGHDLRDVTLSSLRRHIAIVLQDNFLFSGSVRENISYGREDATPEEVEAAAKAVYAHDFIQRLPKGYDTEVHERGGQLSEGQRQLIAFARAILMNPSVLILDEATSHVDPMTEALVQRALEKLLAGRTAFVVAHRLSTIRNADRILVISDGVIAQMGNHDELMAEEGLYKELNEVSFKYT